MMTREEVINGLQEVIDCESLVYLYRAKAIECAIEMLKAQGSRVMTLDEYKAMAEGKKGERDPVWEEWRYSTGGWHMPQKNAYCGYGADWRAWTGRPTEEQRKAEVWE